MDIKYKRKHTNALLYLIIILVIIIIIGLLVFVYIRNIEKTSEKTLNKGKYNTNSHVGNKIEYKGLEYYVLSENNDEIELITVNALGNVTLGYDDVSLKDIEKNNIDINLDGELSSFEKSLYSYQNAINTLINECKKITGLEVDGKTVLEIRNVGGPSKDNASKYFSAENIKNSDWLTQYIPLKIKDSDNIYESDYNKMKELDILVPDNGYNYFFASRNIEVNDERAIFKIRNLYNEMYGWYDEGLIYITPYQEEFAFGTNDSKAVRPIVVLKSGVIDLK